MSHEENWELPAALAGGRQALAEAARTYGRTLSPEDYWWLGVGLGAITLAELGEKPYAVGRLQQLVDQLGRKGTGGDWFQRVVEELANLDAEGLLWPVYQRNAQGLMEPTGVTVAPNFDADHGFFLALAHIGVALSVLRDDQETVSLLAAAVGDIVAEGLREEHRAAIAGALAEEPGEAPEQ